MPVRDLKKEGTDGSRSQVTIRFRIRGNKESYPFLNELAGANRYLWNAGLAHLKNPVRGNRYIRVLLFLSLYMV